MFEISALLLGAHDFDVKADPFSVVAIAMLVKDANLIESAARIDGAERKVLVELESILVIQMNTPEFLVRQGKSHLV